MVSGIEKERKKIEKFFVKQLKNGISLDFYKDRLKQAGELLDKKIIDRDKYEEVKKAYFKKRDMVDDIDKVVDKLTSLVNHQLFFKNTDLYKTYFESLLCYGNKSLLPDYISIGRELDNKIDAVKKEFVDLLDKYATKINFEKNIFPIMGLSIIKLCDYKKIFKDGYDYVNTYINQLTHPNVNVVFDDTLLCVRDNEKTTKLFKLYAYSLSDEIVYIKAVEKNCTRVSFKNKITKLKRNYMQLSVLNLRWIYLNKALYFIKDNSIYENLKTKIQESILKTKYEVDKLSIHNSKTYRHINISKRLEKIDKKYIDISKLEIINTICKEIEKNVDYKDYGIEDSYYYKYYKMIDKQRKLLERKLDLINIPKYINKEKYNAFDIDYLKERYKDFYVENERIDCTEEKFIKYIGESNNGKIPINDTISVDKDKYIDVAGYEESLYSEPLKSFDNEIDSFNIKLSDSAAAMREFLYNQYEILINQPDYDSTFYDFLRDNKKIVTKEIMDYEKEVELFCSLLYEIYLNNKIRKSFVNFVKERGLDYVPLQYIRPDLFIIHSKEKSIIDKYKEKDNKQLEKMIEEALASMSENSE